MAFSVDMWIDTDDRAAGIENVAVWIENGDCYAEVTDRAGNTIECGHNRPTEIDEKRQRWQTTSGEPDVDDS